MVELWNQHPARVLAFLLPVLFVLWRVGGLLLRFRRLKREGLVGNYIAQAIFGAMFASMALVMCEPGLVGLTAKDVGLESPDDGVAPVASVADAKSTKLPSEVKFRGALIPAREAILKDDWATLARVLFDVRSTSREFERDVDFLLVRYAPQLGREFLVLGRGALERGETALGRRYLDFATQYAPDEPDGYLLRSSAVAPEEWKLALSDLDAAIRRCKDGDARLTTATEKRLALRLAHNDPRGALEDVDQLLSQHPEDVVRLAQRGQLRLAAGAVDGAIADLSTASAAVPTDMGLKLELATARLKKEDSLEQAKLAIADLTKVIAAQDGYRPRFLRAQGHFQLKHFPDAVADLSNALKFDPKASEAYFLRGRVKHELDQLNAAKADFTKAIELNREYRAAYFWRGIVTMDGDQKQLALADFTRAYELEADPWSLYYKGECLWGLGRRDEAEAAYSDSLSIAKDPKLVERIKGALERARSMKKTPPKK